jgi:excisionase family DNA binding protein
MSVSFSIPKAAAATGIGHQTIRDAINEGELIAHYVGVKAVIRAVDLDEWIASLPTDKPVRAS